jgi:hypothetical protein
VAPLSLNMLEVSVNSSEGKCRSHCMDMQRNFEAGGEKTNGGAFWRLTSLIRCLVVMGHSASRTRIEMIDALCLSRSQARNPCIVFLLFRRGSSSYLLALNP